jgi:hypothetical protein
MKRRWALIGIAGFCLMVFPLMVLAQSEQGKDPGERLQMQARQAALARLQANRGAFIGEIVERWSPGAKARGLDNASWRADMTNALSAMQPDRLVAAYESTSFDDFLTVMSAKPQRSSSSRAQQIRPLTVGDSDSDLVYNEVAPCRIFDTRFGDVNNGFLNANVVRNYAHNQQLIAQGATLANCGIPTDPAAIAITITVINATGPGNIRAWRYLDPVPVASVANYTNVPGLNLANTTIIPTCQICGFDFSVRADVSGTHLAGDVVGYFWRPTACAAGQANALGECFETSLRAAASIFSASDTCRGLGGKLADPLQLRSLRGGDPLTLDATGGEWTDSPFSADGAIFYGMTIENGGAFARVGTLTLRPYRCNFSQFAH